MVKILGPSVLKVACTLKRTHGSPPGASLGLGTSKALEEGMKLGSKNRRLPSEDSPVA